MGIIEKGRKEGYEKKIWKKMVSSFQEPMHLWQQEFKTSTKLL